MSPYVFITGNGHSGSTLLDLVLGAHPDVISIGELKQFRRYIEQSKDCTCGKKVVECPFWLKVQAQIKNKRGIDIFKSQQAFPLTINKSSNRLIQLLRQALRIAILNAPSSISRLLSLVLVHDRAVAINSLSVYDEVLSISQKKLVVDSSKTPIVMKMLMILRPNHVRAIHIVRDGRAVLNSNLKKNRELDFAIKGWVKTLNLLKLLTSSLSPDRYLTVHYETFCSDTHNELVRICEFLGLEYTDRLLDFRGLERHNIDGNRMRYADTPDIRLDEKWKRELLPHQLRRFNKMAGKLNRKWGY